MPCNRLDCPFCKIDREGCQCLAKDVGCWYCAPTKFKRPICSASIQVFQIPVPEGYRWAHLDDRGWHVVAVEAVHPRTVACGQSISSPTGQTAILRLAAGMGPVGTDPICQLCVANIHLLAPIVIQLSTLQPTAEIDYDAHHRLLQEAKKADSLADMLNKKFNYDGEASQRERAQRLREEAARILSGR